MGGVISAASVPGEGTTVTFELPVETLPSWSPSDAADSPPTLSNRAVAADQGGVSVSKAAASRGVVLVVDDNAVNRHVLADQLSLLGFASRSCDGAKSGLSAWRERDYVLVFLDCQMPDVDGYELCRMMRREEAEKGSTPCIILALSARTESEHTLACLEAGMNGVLTKPLNLNVLRATLDMWTDSAGSDSAARNRGHDIEDSRAHGAEDSCVPGAADSNVYGIKDSSGSNEACDRAESLAALFQRTCAADSAAIRGAISRRDSKELAVCVHRLKGAALAFGNAAVAEIATSIELAGMHADCDWDALAGRVQALDAVIGSPPPQHD
jgi:CheY-like chemotaxis protein/HPt (histidine-containing phosphotransfer) domain-containing protein